MTATQAKALKFVFWLLAFYFGHLCSKIEDIAVAAQIFISVLALIACMGFLTLHDAKNEKK